MKFSLYVTIMAILLTIFLLIVYYIPMNWWLYPSLFLFGIIFTVMYVVERDEDPVELEPEECEEGYIIEVDLDTFDVEWGEVIHDLSFGGDEE